MVKCFANNACPDQMLRSARLISACTVCQLPVLGYPVQKGLRTTCSCLINAVLTNTCNIIIRKLTFNCRFLLIIFIYVHVCSKDLRFKHAKGVIDMFCFHLIFLLHITFSLHWHSHIIMTYYFRVYCLSIEPVLPYASDLSC